MKKLLALVLLTTTVLTTPPRAYAEIRVEDYEGLIKAFSGTDLSVVLDKDIVVNGNLGTPPDKMVLDGNGKSINGNGHAGFYIPYDSSLTIKNFGEKGNPNSGFYNFVRNKTNDDWTDGGVFKLYGEVSLTIEDSVFSNNVAESGGVIHNNVNQGWSYISIKGSEFYNNIGKAYDESSVPDAGVMDINLPVYFSVEDSLFSGNESTYWASTKDPTSPTPEDYEHMHSSGAIHLVVDIDLEADPVIKKSTFINNKAAGYGGAVFIGSDATIYWPGWKDYGYEDEWRGKIIESKFSGNSAVNAGGAMYVTALGVDISKTTFENNSATWGGALFDLTQNDLGANPTYNAEGVRNATIVDSVFKDNTATRAGGAIFLQNDSVDVKDMFIVNTDFTGNKVTEDDLDVGAIGGAIVAGISVNPYTGTHGKTNLNIYADGKNVTFSGNEAKYGKDIYLVGSNLNLVVDPNQKMVFEGGISAEDLWMDEEGTDRVASVININKENGKYTLADGTSKEVKKGGDVYINGTLNAVWAEDEDHLIVNHYAGDLYFGQDGKSVDFEGTILNVLGNNTIITQNDHIDQINTAAFNIDDGIEWAFNFDVDLENEKADFLHNVTNGTDAKVLLSNINLLSGTDASSLEIQYADDNVMGYFKDGDSISIRYGNEDDEYTITADNRDGDGSYLVFEKENTECIGGLNCAVYENDDIYVVDVNETDEETGRKGHHVDKWHQRGGKDKNYLETDLIINGNNSSVYTEEGIQGIVVGTDDEGNGYHLTVNNVSDYTGFEEAVINQGGEVDIVNSNFTGNTGRGGIVNQGGTYNIYGNVTFDNPDADNDIYAEGGEINVKGGKTTFNQNVTGDEDAKFNINGDVDFNGELNGFDVTQKSGTVNVDVVNGSDYTLEGGLLNVAWEEHFQADDLTFSGGNMNIINNRTGDVSVGSVSLKGKTNLTVDLDMAAETMDRLLAAVLGEERNGTINVNKFNLLAHSTKPRVSINFTEGELKEYITTDITRLKGSVYHYYVEYDPETGNFNFFVNGNNWNDFNPSVLAGAVAAQSGYLAMLDTYDEAFRNMDMYKLKTRKSPKAYSWNRTPYDTTTFWVKTRGLFEDLPLKNGPTVSNNFYGLYFGAESEMKEYGSWDGVWSVYGGSTNSYQKIDTIKAHENGGVMGLVGMGYKGNFYTGLNVSLGAMEAKAKDEGNRDKFSMYSAGIASKTGYNYLLDDGKYVIQPYNFMSYTRIDVDNYTTAEGARIRSKGLNAFQLEPGIKFIANYEHELQPYLGVSYVWSFMDNAKFTADSVDLPEFSIKPYLKYGGGIRKTWDENMTGYVQIYKLDGGRHGTDIQAGLNIPFNWK